MPRVPRRVAPLDTGGAHVVRPYGWRRRERPWGRRARDRGVKYLLALLAAGCLAALTELATGLVGAVLAAILRWMLPILNR